MSEDFYDAEIAPKLAGIAKLCEEHGMSLVAKVEFEPGKHGTTVERREGASYPMLLAEWAAMCNGNVDLLTWKIMAHAREHGHSSAQLSVMGVPPQPRSLTVELLRGAS